MKNFIKKYRYILLTVLYLEIALLPTEITLFYKNRDFVDLGLLISAVAIVIFTIPIYNLIKRHNDEKKGL